ncbi:MAG: SP family xylose:H+ symportor-like MFS transporter [Cocleimonas sp.]|jgi:SP family xylose:H+ symportor-like MFS transporter
MMKSHEKVQQQHINMKYIWLISLTAACGGLLFGYDWVVIGGAKPFYEAYFAVNSPAQSGWLMSSALLGCIAGAVLAGVFADRVGRKKTLIISAFLFIISALGTALAASINIFVLFRIVGGVGIGLASTVSPMYISEISPAEKRGKLIAVNQLTIVIGVLAAQLINLMIAEPVVSGVDHATIINSWNGQNGWRYMFAAELVPASLFFILMFIVPESPRWLISKGQSAAAKTVLCKIGSEQYANDSIAEIQASFNQEQKSFKPSDLRLISPLLIIGITLASFQQWCGINVIFNYAHEVFASAGFDIDDTLKSIVATGLINLIFTLLALPMVDKVGRRTLMIIGALGLAVIYLIIATMYYLGVEGFPLLFMVLCGIAVYASTLAPVTWVLLAEIFPNHLRGPAMAISTFALWVASFGLTFTFPFLIAAFGASGSFLFYSLICFAAFRFIYLFVPETKKLSLEQIEIKLSGSKLARQN